MNYDQLIKNWHLKASDEDYFSKYVFEYLAFIAFLKRKRFTDATSDRNAIQRLKQDQSLKHLYLQKVEGSQDVKRAWQNIKNELDRVRLGNVSQGDGEVEEIKWWNYSGEHLDGQSQAEQQKIKGVIHGLDDWENMVEFWYSIRNNLFHGAKNPQDDRDRLLVENGYKSLSGLVATLIHEENL